MNRVTRISAIVGLVSLAILPCGCDSGPKMVAVEGTISVDGKPMDKIMIEFWPLGEGQRSFGETDSQGHYVLQTDDGKRKGVVVGNHKVTMKDSAIFGGKFWGRKAETMDITEGRKSRIAGVYNNSDKTPLTQAVEAGKTKIDFDIKSK